MLHLVRHGQGHHNVANDSWKVGCPWGFACRVLLLNCWCQDNGKVGIRPIAKEAGREDLADAMLTQQGAPLKPESWTPTASSQIGQGEAEAVALQPVLRDTNPTLCVVSPLQRAYRTLLVGFGRLGQEEKAMEASPAEALHETAVVYTCIKLFVVLFVSDGQSLRLRPQKRQRCPPAGR